MARRRGLALSSLFVLSVLIPAGLSLPARSLPVTAGTAASGPVAAVFADDPTAAPVEPEATPPPTTQAPTEPPTTQAPTTVAPTEPVQTTPDEPTQPVEPTEPVEPTAPVTTVVPTIIISPDTTGNSTPVWPWVLAGLGALILLGGIIWFARSSSRRTDAAATWQTRRLNAYAEGAALHDAILSASSGTASPGTAPYGSATAETVPYGAPVPGRSGPANEAQWAEIQRRANDFTQRLYQLREAAPDQDGQLRSEHVLSSLQALRSAMDTERASGSVHGMTADITRERLNDFRVSLYALRDPE
jgi:hypothetical protein